MCAVFSQIMLVKEEFIVKNWVKRVRKVYFWILKRKEGSDDNKNGSIGIIRCLLQFRFWRNSRASG